MALWFLWERSTGTLFSAQYVKNEFKNGAAEDLLVDGETYECVKSFWYLGDTLDGDGGADLTATARIRNGWMKGRVYASCVRSSMTYGSETRPLLVDVGSKFERAEMQMIRWMCGISLKDRRTNEELRRLVRVEPITTFIRSGRLRWYGHMMRKGDDDWVKECMEYRVEGREPVGRPRKTWLESGGHLVLSSHPISLLLQVPRGVCVVQ